MSETKRFRDSIPAILEKCSSIEQYLANPDLAGWVTREHLEQFAAEVGKLSIVCFEEVIRILKDDGLWRRLSANPKEFDRKLGLVLRCIKSQMKRIYSIPSHRPIKNATRDRRILELKKADPSMTPGRIAIEIDLSSKQEGTVDMVLRRAKDRDRDDLRKLLEALADWEDLFRELDPKP